MCGCVLGSGCVCTSDVCVFGSGHDVWLYFRVRSCDVQFIQVVRESRLCSIRGDKDGKVHKEGSTMHLITFCLAHKSNVDMMALAR